MRLRKHYVLYIPLAVKGCRELSWQLRTTLVLYVYVLFCFVLFWFCFVLGPDLQHVEGPRLGVKSELYLLAYTTTTATPDPSNICDLQFSSWQCQILNPLSESRDWTCILMDTSQIGFRWATMGTPVLIEMIHQSKNIVSSWKKLSLEQQRALCSE